MAGQLILPPHRPWPPSITQDSRFQGACRGAAGCPRIGGLSLLRSGGVLQEAWRGSPGTAFADGRPDPLQGCLFGPADASTDRITPSFLAGADPGGS